MAKLVGNATGQANDITVATGLGVIDADTQRVVLATDQPTVPVSAASLPLPAGAATAAKQPALGTAGTPSADVITVQGAAAGTALKTDGSAVTQPVSIATAPVLVAGAAVIGKVGIDQSGPGTTNLVALAANQSVNVAQVNGVAPTMGNGIAGTGVQRVTLASDGTGVVGLAAGTAAIGKLAANTGVIIGDVNVVSAIPGVTATSTGKAEDAVAASGDTGVMVLGVRTDASATQTSADGDYGALSLDLKGQLFTTPGRCSTATLANVASSATSVTVLAANTSRKGVIIYNDSTQVLYLKFGATASTTSFTYYLAAGATWETPAPLFTGVLDGIWASANGNARVTELTA